MSEYIPEIPGESDSTTEGNYLTSSEEPTPPSDVENKRKNIHNIVVREDLIPEGILQSVKRQAQNIRNWNPLQRKFDQSLDVKVNELELESLVEGLVKGVNRIELLLAEAKVSPDKSQRNYIKVADLACKMLQQVIGNVNFRKTVRQLHAIREQNDEEFAKIILTFEELEKFFEREYQILKEYNVPNADSLIDNGRLALYGVRAGEAPHTDIYEAIEELRRAVCNLRTDLNFGQVREILILAITGIGGCTLVILNFQVQANGILSAVEASLSQYTAAGIIGVAANDVRKLVGPLIP